MKSTRILSTFAAVLALASILGAQDRSQDNPAANAQRRSMLPNAKLVKHDGKPSLELDGPNGWAMYILLGMRQGEPSLGFAVAQRDCQGIVYVTRTRISGDFRNTACDSFDVAHQGATASRGMGAVVLASGSSSYEVVPQAERNGERQPMRGPKSGAEFLIRAVNNFDPVMRNLHRIAGQLREQTPVANASEKKPVMAKMATIAITSDPGEVEVYVNDTQRGSTDEDGHESLQLPPGIYRVRLSMPGYKDSEQQVTLVAGATQQVSGKLEPTGPPPFSESDVTEMLEGKMSTKRIATLVQERGVDFDLNPDLEKRLRGMGATSDLLLVVATNRKK